MLLSLHNDPSGQGENCSFSFMQPPIHFWGYTHILVVLSWFSKELQTWLHITLQSCHLKPSGQTDKNNIYIK